VSLSVPLSGPIPANAVYRKYSASASWYDFEMDANNRVASAPGEANACPLVNSDAYTDGLTAGHMCVQITIEDGGPNDIDGEVNGTIVDPSGIAVLKTPAAQPVPEPEPTPEPTPTPEPVAKWSSSGGCTLVSGSSDQGLVFILALALLGLTRRRWRAYLP
jgi:MYXO-CTERM domain-containing protein